MQVTKCPAYEDYDIFGLDRSGCCYKFYDFCKNIEHCSIKDMLYKYGNEGIEKALEVKFEEESTN